MRQTAEHLAIDVGVGRACQVLGVPRSSVYRHREIRQKTEQDLPKKRPTPSRAMEKQERTQVLDVLNSDRFVDAAPRQVYAQLLVQAYKKLRKRYERFVSENHNS